MKYLTYILTLFVLLATTGFVSMKTCCSGERSTCHFSAENNRKDQIRKCSEVSCCENKTEQKGEDFDKKNCCEPVLEYINLSVEHDLVFHENHKHSLECAYQEFEILYFNSFELKEKFKPKLYKPPPQPLTEQVYKKNMVFLI